MAIRYRAGGCWKVTLIEYDDAEEPDEQGRRPSDRLLGMLLTPEITDAVVRELNYAAWREGRDDP